MKKSKLTGWIKECHEVMAKEEKDKSHRHCKHFVLVGRFGFTRAPVQSCNLSHGMTECRGRRSQCWYPKLLHKKH